MTYRGALMWCIIRRNDRKNSIVVSNLTIDKLNLLSRTQSRQSYLVLTSLFYHV